MKRTNIYLDEEQDKLLRHLSIEEGRSFTALVREALDEYLLRRGIAPSSQVSGPRRSIPDDVWRERFESSVSAIRSRVPNDLTVEAVEADISAAVQEVQEQGVGQGS